MTRSTRTPKSRPVIARRAPIGHARTRTGAIRLAYRFASAADRALFDAGRIKLRELVTDRYPLDQVNEAIRAMRGGEVSGRCLITL